MEWNDVTQLFAAFGQAARLYWADDPPAYKLWAAQGQQNDGDVLYLESRSSEGVILSHTIAMPRYGKGLDNVGTSPELLGSDRGDSGHSAVLLLTALPALLQAPRIIRQERQWRALERTHKMSRRAIRLLEACKDAISPAQHARLAEALRYEWSRDVLSRRQVTETQARALLCGWNRVTYRAVALHDVGVADTGMPDLQHNWRDESGVSVATALVYQDRILMQVRATRFDGDAARRLVDCCASRTVFINGEEVPQPAA